MKTLLMLVEGLIAFFAFIAIWLQEIEYATLFVAWAVYLRIQRKDDYQ